VENEVLENININDIDIPPENQFHMLFQKGKPSTEPSTLPKGIVLKLDCIYIYAQKCIFMGKNVYLCAKIYI